MAHDKQVCISQKQKKQCVHASIAQQKKPQKIYCASSLGCIGAYQILNLRRFN